MLCFVFLFPQHLVDSFFCESNREYIRRLAEQTVGFPGSVSASLPSAKPSMLTGSQKLPVVQETMGAWCTFWMQDR